MRPLIRGILVVLLLAASALAQNVEGTVFDGTGAVVSGARVLLMSQDYVKLAEMQSGDRGEFAFRDLKPGLHLVQVKIPTFQLCQQHTVLEAGKTNRLDMVLLVARGIDHWDIQTDRLPDVEPVHNASYNLRAGGRVSGLKRVAGRPPGYPEAARKRAASGTVALYVTVKADGSVGDVVTLGPADFDLDRASREAIAGWKYEPMKLNGMPVETYTTVYFHFGYR